MYIKDNSKKERLQLFAATRWESRNASIKAIVSSCEYLLTFLDVSLTYNKLNTIF
jgi:phosphopantetheinyl transferase (holo-ACP synthase)